MIVLSKDMGFKSIRMVIFILESLIIIKNMVKDIFTGLLYHHLLKIKRNLFNIILEVGGEGYQMEKGHIKKIQEMFTMEILKMVSNMAKDNNIFIMVILIKANILMVFLRVLDFISGKIKANMKEILSKV